MFSVLRFDCTSLCEEEFDWIKTQLELFFPDEKVDVGIRHQRLISMPIGSDGICSAHLQSIDQTLKEIDSLFEMFDSKSVKVLLELDICIAPEDMGEVISEFAFTHTFMASLVGRKIDLNLSLYCT